jgi:hypothetical protein
MINLDKHAKEQLISLYETKKIGLEGNILRLFDVDGDEEFEKYITKCIEEDKNTRRIRLSITKRIQSQNNELNLLNEENLRILSELNDTLETVESDKLTYEVQNKELNDWKLENIRLTEELKNEMIKSEQARISAETAKENAENDLDLIQKRNQTELISIIVKVALWMIIGVGVITTLVYIITLIMDKDTQVISAAWANMFGILLTNAFSIVGTIMGIKYASKNDC